MCGDVRLEVLEGPGFCATRRTRPDEAEGVRQLLGYGAASDPGWEFDFLRQQSRRFRSSHGAVRQRRAADRVGGPENYARPLDCRLSGVWSWRRGGNDGILLTANSPRGF